MSKVLYELKSKEEKERVFGGSLAEMIDSFPESDAALLRGERAGKLDFDGFELALQEFYQFFDRPIDSETFLKLCVEYGLSFNQGWGIKMRWTMPV